MGCGGLGLARRERQRCWHAGLSAPSCCHSEKHAGRAELYSVSQLLRATFLCQRQQLQLPPPASGMAGNKTFSSDPRSVLSFAWLGFWKKRQKQPGWGLGAGVPSGLPWSWPHFLPTCTSARPASAGVTGRLRALLPLR